MKTNHQDAIDRAYRWVNGHNRTREEKIEYLRNLKDEQTAFRVVSVLQGDYSKVSKSCFWFEPFN